MKRGDLLPVFVATLYGADNLPVDLTSATSVNLALKYTTGGTPIYYLTMVKDPDQNANRGKCSYEWVAGNTDTPGTFNGEIVVSFSGKEQTFPTNGYFTVSIIDDLESHS